MNAHVPPMGQYVRLAGGLIVLTSAQLPGSVHYLIHHPYLPPLTSSQVLYSKFGFMYTDIKLAGSDYILIREQDVIAIMPQKSEGRWGESVRAAREA